MACLLQRHRLQVAPGARIDVRAHTVMGPKRLPMTVHPQDRDFRRTPGVRGKIRGMVDS